MKKIKLWITDIDGTIVNTKNEISELMQNTIQKVKESGVKIVLASGRMYDGIKPIADMLGLDTPIVCYQGAMVKQNDKVLWQSSVKNEIAREIIQYLRDKKIHTNLYNNDILLVENDDKRLMKEYTHGRFVEYEVVKSFDDVELKNISKLLAIIEDEDLLYSIQNDLREKYKNELTVVRSHQKYLEITDKNASKGCALRFLMEHFDIKKDEILASGDNDNDIDMLEVVDHSIAMGNATKDMKKCAFEVCAHVDDDGLVEILNRYLL